MNIVSIIGCLSKHLISETRGHGAALPKTSGFYRVGRVDSEEVF